MKIQAVTSRTTVPVSPVPAKPTKGETGHSTKSTLAPKTFSCTSLVNIVKKLAVRIWKFLSCGFCAWTKKTEKKSGPAKLKPTPSSVLTPKTKAQQEALGAYNAAAKIAQKRVEHYIQELPLAIELQKKQDEDEKLLAQATERADKIIKHFEPIHLAVCFKLDRGEELSEQERLYFYKERHEFKKEKDRIKREGLTLDAAIKQRIPKLEAFEKEHNATKAAVKNAELAIDPLTTTFSLSKDQLLPHLPRKEYIDCNGDKLSSYLPLPQ